MKLVSAISFHVHGFHFIIFTSVFVSFSGDLHVICIVTSCGDLDVCPAVQGLTCSLFSVCHQDKSGDDGPTRENTNMYILFKYYDFFVINY